MPADPWNNPDTWSAWQALLPHVLTTTHADLDPAGGDDVAWLLDCAATYLQTRGQPRQARPLFNNAPQRRRQLLGEDHPDTLISAQHLALDLRALGEHNAARQLNEDTLARQRQVLGEDHPQTLTSGQQPRRRPTYAGRAHCRPPTPRGHAGPSAPGARRGPPILFSATNLAIDLHALGEYEQARQLNDDTLTRSRRVLGDNHRTTLAAANNLALDLHALGEHAAADQLEEWIHKQSGK